MTAAWIESAACASTDPALYYADNATDTRAAVRVCGGCPVAVECRANAIATGDNWGVQGGLTESQRWRLVHGPGKSPSRAQKAGNAREQQIEHGTRAGDAGDLREGEPYCVACTVPIPERKAS